MDSTLHVLGWFLAAWGAVGVVYGVSELIYAARMVADDATSKEVAHEAVRRAVCRVVAFVALTFLGIAYGANERGDPRDAQVFAAVVVITLALSVTAVGDYRGRRRRRNAHEVAMFDDLPEALGAVKNTDEEERP
jgi:hypothetical protein